VKKKEKKKEKKRKKKENEIPKEERLDVDDYIFLAKGA